MATRYPRTPHLPWSEGATGDDVRVPSVAAFAGLEVVVTEKLDGENTTLYRDHLHARSLDMSAHPSRTWIKAYHDRVRLEIPPGYRACGEGLFAKHALRYADLESWFYVFSVWTPDDDCLDWDATVAFGKRIGAPTPRVLFRGLFDEKKLRALPIDRTRVEGYVVRTTRGFHRDDFAAHLAKYVRANHVVTDQHWAHAPVTENGRSPRALLWDIRSGLRAPAADVASVLGIALPHGADPPVDARLDAVQDGLDALGRRGDARLEGVIAAVLSPLRRSELAPLLAPKLGVRIARRAADLVGLARALREPFPDENRARGLRSLCRATDLGVLHALASATATSPTESDLVRWSELHATDAGLLDTDDEIRAPLAALRHDARAALDGIPAARAQRAWSAMVERWVDGRVHGIDDAMAATFAERTEDRASVVLTVGPSGSGKSTLVRDAFADHAVVSLDDLRAERGDRADQSDNRALLGRALADLEELVKRGRQIVWDATSLGRAQRSLVLDVASRAGALASLVVFARSRADLERTNAARGHAIPPAALEQQLARFSPPYPGEADRILYAGPTGTIDDTAGDLFNDEHDAP